MKADSGKEGHWQEVYARRNPYEVSWFEPSPETSLALIAEASLPKDGAILDAGGGTSSLAGELLRGGYSDVSVADISTRAIERSKAALGGDADRIDWIHADLRSHEFDRSYDLWHDRAAFHFMVSDFDRDSYVSVLQNSVRPGGDLILGTFGPDGPTECSSLPVHRYGVEELAALLHPYFRPVDSKLVEHQTPAGGAQQFVFAHFARLGQNRT
jgi:SAM-dependent methyltransferase